ncbi:MAG: MCP four helix bundle domain-containing protein [Candidatus Rokubacteria bacterium]|nr:MCP four helix bundle domain-containing protein [Candidatus Rokubacteria bacterium]
MSHVGWGEGIARLLLTRSPLGLIVRWIASIRASVHAKLLCGFMLVTLLFIAMGVMSLQTVAKMSRQSQLMQQAHDRGDWSLQMEHAFAMQMNFTSLALILKDEATIGRILRENNRFNNTLARIEEAAPPEERELIQRIRTAQEEAMTTVADIANLVRDGRLDEATTLQVATEYPLYVHIEALINQVVKIEQDKMESLRRSVAAENQRAMILMGGFVAASILLALLLGFVISWSFILPVREAQSFLGQVAKGNFGVTVTVPNRDEFGVLADHLNRMSRELHRLYEDQREAARELTTLNEKLKRASMAKSEFLASMSHELRTPMNAILGFTELMLDGIYGEIPPSLKGPLTDVQVNGKHLLRLINEVLDLSKIEAGRMELSLGEYSARDVVETVTASLRSLAAEKGLDFVARVQEDIPAAVGDAKRITQCLMNLAGNALKFTKEGRVEISVELKANTLLYRVSDTGIGIPQDQIGKLFEEFRQLDPTVAHEFGGTGLGLSITKKFVELHGGRVWAESQVGQGSTFFFTVPLRGDKGRPA